MDRQQSAADIKRSIEEAYDRTMVMADAARAHSREGVGRIFNTEGAVVCPVCHKGIFNYRINAHGGVSGGCDGKTCERQFIEVVAPSSVEPVEYLPLDDDDGEMRHSINPNLTEEQRDRMRRYLADLDSRPSNRRSSDYFGRRAE